MTGHQPVYPRRVRAEAPDRLPVHVLTGFLGSGKTTLLNRLLATPALHDSAVIVNEFGDIGLDHLLVERSDDMLVELSGGCLCCRVRGDLASTLTGLLARRDDAACPPFGRIIIETSGAADPNPILNLLVTDPLLAERTVAAGLLTTVDAANGPDTLQQHASAAAQVALARTVVVTKCDLADPGPARARIAALNAHAALFESRADALPDPMALLDDSAEPPCPAPPGAAHHRHGHALSSFVYRRRQPLPGAVLPLLVDCLARQLGSRLLRVKGLMSLEEYPDRPAVLHGAQHVFHALELLDGWPPDMDTGTTLVFIVHDPDGDHAALLASWMEQLVEMMVWEVRDTAARLDPHAAAAAVRHTAGQVDERRGPATPSKEDHDHARSAGQE